MVSFDFTVKERKGVDIITFGTPDKKITIDVTFVPSAIGYAMKDLLKRDETTDRYTPETLAGVIAKFTTEVDAQWIVENTTYSTLDQIVAIIVNKAFARTDPEEKN